MLRPGLLAFRMSALTSRIVDAVAGSYRTHRRGFITRRRGVDNGDVVIVLITTDDIEDCISCVDSRPCSVLR